MLKKAFILTIGLMVPALIYSQAETEVVKRTNREEIQTLKKRVSELDSLSRELLMKIEESEKEDEMRRLMEEAMALSTRKAEKEAASERKFHSALRQQSALNPNISLGGDYYAAYGTSKSEYNRIPSETSWGTGKIFLREMEFSLQAPLDPFTRGKVFFSFGQEGVCLEEGYMQWLNLPLNMNLKIGEYKTQFGKFNRIHDHALPQFERPLVLSNFFGFTTLKGFGVAANLLLPRITAHVNELDLEVISGGADRSFTSGGKHNLIYVVHFKNYYDLNRSTYFEVGFSGATGKNDSTETYRSLLGGIDINFRWAPPGRSKYRGVEWITEFLFSDREQAGFHTKTWGCFSSLQWRLNARWLMGVRVDYSQLPWNADLKEQGGAVCMDYWQSEFVFVRFQYTYIDRNFDEDDHRFILQTVWAMGPHKHEKY